MKEIPTAPPLPNAPPAQDFSKLGFVYITVLGLANQVVPHTGSWRPMEPALTPKPTISPPSTSDAAGQSSQFLGVLYLALTGLIDSALPAAGPWAVAGKALSYLVKLGPIIWWAMPVPSSTPPSPAGALQYSWYPENCVHAFQARPASSVRVQLDTSMGCVTRDDS
ncbi:hypothetical protein DSO57_1024560 [Entomophthora muscae]|uniref:Uncharacterized protein n=1 Tax=Entomophthora muscae TaxID=34485 RepID=A0ACC2RH54_9FUNG|nr:hypothetical protein DSO57_1024560 [Entomophthora muscae]